MLTQEELDKLLEQGAEGLEETPAKPEPPPQAAAEPDLSQDMDWGAAFEEAAKAGDAAAAKAMDDPSRGLGGAEPASLKQPTAVQQPAPVTSKPPKFTSAAPPVFDDLSKKGKVSGAQVDRPNLDFILDIPLDIAVELGRTKMQIRDLLQLGQGSIVTLNKLAGEPAEIYINQKLIGKGEVVVINEKFGIRLNEIISPADRVKNLA
ncbi:MAG: flagellar motor switch protein FliN [Deltaproteobacteria bacterium]|jgi:flagellar motor switch protein FliN/FliY|nr:flagellar motor switch protein FliN [Deltaproteobacteria bacterium]